MLRMLLILISGLMLSACSPRASHDAGSGSDLTDFEIELPPSNGIYVSYGMKFVGLSEDCYVVEIGDNGEAKGGVAKSSWVSNIEASTSAQRRTIASFSLRNCDSGYRMVLEFLSSPLREEITFNDIAPEMVAYTNRKVEEQREDALVNDDGLLIPKAKLTGTTSQIETVMYATKNAPPGGPGTLKVRSPYSDIAVEVKFEVPKEGLTKEEQFDLYVKPVVEVFCSGCHDGAALNDYRGFYEWEGNSDLVYRVDPGNSETPMPPKRDVDDPTARFYDDAQLPIISLDDKYPNAFSRIPEELKGLTVRQFLSHWAGSL